MQFLMTYAHKSSLDVHVRVQAKNLNLHILIKVIDWTLRYGRDKLRRRGTFYFSAIKFIKMYKSPTVRLILLNSDSV